jgi:hypothetical protein
MLVGRLSGDGVFGELLDAIVVGDDDVVDVVA